MKKIKKFWHWIGHANEKKLKIAIRTLTICMFAALIFEFSPDIITYLINFTALGVILLVKKGKFIKWR